MGNKSSVSKSGEESPSVQQYKLIQQVIDKMTDQEIFDKVAEYQIDISILNYQAAKRRVGMSNEPSRQYLKHYLQKIKDRISSYENQIDGKETIGLSTKTPEERKNSLEAHLKPVLDDVQDYNITRAYAEGGMGSAQLNVCKKRDELSDSITKYLVTKRYYAMSSEKSLDLSSVNDTIESHVQTIGESH